jgi:hypothetical protein
MLKLYKRVEDRLLYHEAWLDDGKIVADWGVVGEKGESRGIPLQGDRRDEDQLVEAAQKDARADGFARVALENHAKLIMEYPFRDASDLKKRRELEDRLNETLGWTGLGFCDGGSAGSGTMEVCCFVVNFAIAEKVIRDDLAETKFADYSRIHDEDGAPGALEVARGRQTGEGLAERRISRLRKRTGKTAKDEPASCPLSPHAGRGS